MELVSARQTSSAFSRASSSTVDRSSVPESLMPMSNSSSYSASRRSGSSDAAAAAMPPRLRIPPRSSSLPLPPNGSGAQAPPGRAAAPRPSGSAARGPSSGTAGWPPPAPAGSPRQRVLGGAGSSRRCLTMMSMAEGPSKGSSPAEELVEHDAAGVEVGAGVGLLPLKHLGGEVVRRADDEAGLGLPGREPVDRPGDAEVHQLGVAGGLQDQVLGLDVAVEHAHGVGGAEAGAELLGEAQARRVGEPAASGRACSAGSRRARTPWRCTARRRSRRSRRCAARWDG